MAVPRRGSPPEQLDLPFEGKLVGAAGSMLGSGAIMVMDDTTDIPTAALTLTRFYAHESCGQCTPCREGGTWLERILQRIVDGHGTRADLDQLLEIGESICPGDFPHAASERARPRGHAVPVQDDHDLLRRSVGLRARCTRRSRCSATSSRPRSSSASAIPVRIDAAGAH